jgi:uncharacterized protein YciI
MRRRKQEEDRYSVCESPVVQCSTEQSDENRRRNRHSIVKGKENPMYILFITSTKSLQELEPVFPAHNAYLDTNYKAGKILLNGELTAQPTIVLLANVTSEEELQAMLAEDPFVRERLVDIEKIEFKPSRYHQSLASLIAPVV